MAMNDLVVSCVQMTAVDGEKAATVNRALDLVDRAGRQGARLVVLPEVWTGLGFSGANLYREIAETIPGPVTAMLGTLARTYGMYITGSFYEKTPDGKYFNSAPLVGPNGEVVGVYRKTHLFDGPQRPDIKVPMQESAKLSAGSELPVFDTPFGKLGITICSDLRFPEIYRTLTLKGARIIVCVSAFLNPRFDHWEILLRARAIENLVYVLGSGQFDREPRTGIGFVGRSTIVDPWGVMVATAPDRETCVTTSIDLDFIDEIRSRCPTLEQRRPDLYAAVSSRAG